MSDEQSDNVEVRVRFLPKAFRAVEDTAKLLGFSRTDVINRAVQLYAFLEMERRVSGADLALVAPDGHVRVLSFGDDSPEIKARVAKRTVRQPWWRRWAS